MDNDGAGVSAPRMRVYADTMRPGSKEQSNVGMDGVRYPSPSAAVFSPVGMPITLGRIPVIVKAITQVHSNETARLQSSQKSAVQMVMKSDPGRPDVRRRAIWVQRDHYQSGPLTGRLPQIKKMGHGME